MRIVLISHYFEPENSAPQRRWSALIRAWASAGHDIDVFAPPPHYPNGRVLAGHRHLGPGTSAKTETGARVYRTHYLRHGADILTRTLDHVVAAGSAYLTARDVLRRNGTEPDVVIATAPAVPSLVAGSLLARAWGVPFVAEMRDAWPDLVTHVPGFNQDKGLGGRIKRAIHRRITTWQRDAALVITTTEAFAQVLRSRGVQPVVVIRNGTDITRYESLASRASSDHALRVLYIGNIGRSQGLDTVMHAVADMLRNGVQVEARFVGYGADVNRLARLNHSLGHPVDLRGAVTAAEVAHHYEWADTIIVSLRNWEPFEWTIPSKLFDALASGRHVTGIIAGEAAELLRASGAGHVVPPGARTELVRLWTTLSEDPTPLSIGSAGRDWVKRYATHDILARQYLEGLEAVASERRGKNGKGR